jgi:hypothetical protein
MLDMNCWRGLLGKDIEYSGAHTIILQLFCTSNTSLFDKVLEVYA